MINQGKYDYSKYNFNQGKDDYHILMAVGDVSLGQISYHGSSKMGSSARIGFMDGVVLEDLSPAETIISPLTPFVEVVVPNINTESNEPVLIETHGSDTDEDKISAEDTQVIQNVGDDRQSVLSNSYTQDFELSISDEGPSSESIEAKDDDSVSTESSSIVSKIMPILFLLNFIV